MGIEHAAAAGRYPKNSRRGEQKADNQDLRKIPAREDRASEGEDMTEQELTRKICKIIAGQNTAVTINSLMNIMAHIIATNAHEPERMADAFANNLRIAVVNNAPTLN